MHAPADPLPTPAEEGLPKVADAPISLALIADVVCRDAAEVLASWEEHLSLLKRDHEIFVVGPEASTDLVSLREALSVQETRLQVVTYPDAPGDGPALRTALATARHPILLYLPCDRQYHPNDLERLLKVINEVHLACGYRVYRPVPGWLTWLDLTKRFFSRILLGTAPPRRECWLGWKGWRRRFLARWLFGLRLQDVECRFRLLRTDFFRRIPIQSHGTFAHLELLAKANHLECIMAEAPVSWVSPSHGSDDPHYASDRNRVIRQAEFVHVAAPQQPTTPLASDEKVASGPASGG